jgi:molybdopterin-guanine dinucleotide biosynthesis protein
VTLEELLRPHATVTIVGLAKNAGKTTVVNHLLERLDGRIGLASLGLDGEARDQLTGLAKPRIAPPAGALVLTTVQLRGQTPMVRELPFRTAAGEVVIVAAGGGEAVVVSGPTRLDELDEALGALRPGTASSSSSSAKSRFTMRRITSRGVKCSPAVSFDCSENRLMSSSKM